MNEPKLLNNVERMYEMLKYKRPHRSKTERNFIRRFISPLGDSFYDKIGNRYIQVGNAPIMYSCHTDSVHRLPGLQNVSIKGNKFKLHRKENSNCLGADNAAGVWIMTEMIRAGKPGLYIFHRGEEIGGVGSGYISKHTPELVKGIQIAMAFDRRNTKSIITFQAGQRCCSDEFADSLAKELHLKHEKDRGGTFTDTANYTDLIPECTNVSVGFEREHSSYETLDMAYLMELRQAMLELDWEKLVIKRKAGDYEPRWSNYSYSSYYDGATSYSGSPRRWRWVPELRDWAYFDKATGTWIRENPGIKRSSWDYNKETNELTYKKPAGFLVDGRPKDKQESLLPDGHELGEGGIENLKSAVPSVPRKIVTSEQSNDETSLTNLCEMVRNNPLLISKMLMDYGITPEDVADFLYTNNGIIPPEMLGGAVESNRVDDETDPKLL